MSQDLHQTISLEYIKGNASVSDGSSVTPGTAPFSSTLAMVLLIKTYADKAQAADPRSAQHRIPFPLNDLYSNRDFSDGADPLFDFYLDTASDEDQTMARRWQTDADGILIFVSSIIFIDVMSLRI